MLKSDREVKDNPQYAIYSVRVTFSFIFLWLSDSMEGCVEYTIVRRDLYDLYQRLASSECAA